MNGMYTLVELIAPAGVTRRERAVFRLEPGCRLEFVPPLESIPLVHLDGVFMDIGPESEEQANRRKQQAAR